MQARVAQGNNGFLQSRFRNNSCLGCLAIWFIYSQVTQVLTFNSCCYCCSSRVTLIHPSLQVVIIEQWNINFVLTCMYYPVSTTPAIWHLVRLRRWVTYGFLCPALRVKARRAWFTSSSAWRPSHQEHRCHSNRGRCPTWLPADDLWHTVLSRNPPARNGTNRTCMLTTLIPGGARSKSEVVGQFLRKVY